MLNSLQQILSKPSLNRFLILLAVCAFGISLSCRNMVFSGLQQMQTDPGDTRFNNYILEHEYQWATGNPLHSSFWDAPVFFPAQNVMAYSDILLGVAPIYGLLRLTGLMPDTAYQLWVMILLGLNFYLTYWVFRRLSFSFFPSLVAGYLFAFANMRIGQLGHPQVLPHFFTSLTLLAMHEIFLKPGRSRIWIAALAGSITLQLYSGFYLGWFGVFGLFLACAVGMLTPRTRSQLLRLARKEAAFLTVVGIFSLLTLSPMAYHYWLASQEVGLRNFASVSPMLIRATSWLNLGDDNFLYGFLHHFSAFKKIPTPGEQRVGLGLVTLIIAILGLKKAGKKSPARISIWVWGLIAILTLYTGRRFLGVEPWELVYSTFPGAKAIRAVSRICLLMLIPACIGLAYFFEGIKNKKAISIGLFLVLILEQVNSTPSYDKLAIRNDVQTLVSQIPIRCRAFFYTASRSQEPSYKLHIDAIWAGLILNIPTLNGYSGNSPHNWGLTDINEDILLSRSTKTQDALLSWTKTQSVAFDPHCWIDSTALYPDKH